GDAAADVVAHGAHGESSAGGHHAADGHAVAVMRVRGEDGVADAGEPPRVLDLRAQRLLRFREERLRHEDAHLALLRALAIEAAGIAAERVLPRHHITLARPRDQTDAGALPSGSTAPMS